MGDRILGLVSLAIIGAMLGDALVNYNGTKAFLGGVKDLLTTTYKAAGGAYSGPSGG